MSNTTPYPADQNDELARNAALFFEADHLEAHAYSLIEGDSTSAISWERFTEAKALADAKRSEAQGSVAHSRAVFE
jgi:hypothetical protein